MSRREPSWYAPAVPVSGGGQIGNPFDSVIESGAATAEEIAADLTGSWPPFFPAGGTADVVFGIKVWTTKLAR